MKKTRLTSLKALLFLIGLVTLLLFSGVYVASSYVIEQDGINRALKSECDLAVNRLASALAIPLWNFDISNIKATMNAEAQSADIRRITVSNERGEIVAWVNRGPEGKLTQGTSPLPDKLVTTSFFYAAQNHIINNKRNIGILELSVSRDARMNEFASRLMSTVRLLLFSTLACICALLVSVQYLIVRRITGLSRVVKEFTSSGFAKRMPVDRADEVGLLAESFNSMAQTISEHAQNLEQLVKERSAQLVEAEKLAFLGSLVAGFAHEINTPIGVALTATTYQENLLKDLSDQYTHGTMRRTDLENLIRELGTSQELVYSSLERTNRLIQTFKSVGIDQIQNDVSLFSLKNYLEEVLLTLGPRLRTSGLEVHLNMPAELRIWTSPSAFYQIFTLLILNVIIHAYPEGGPGRIDLSAQTGPGGLEIQFRDYGLSIADEFMPRVFTPFFTTRHSDGHVGLGLYIVYTAVKKMAGNITCSKPQGGGLLFTLMFPPNILVPVNT